MLGAGYDEVFDAHGVARSHYQPLCERLRQLQADDLRQRQTSADLAFLNQGITFTVYGGGEGAERIFPYDLVPRIITSEEWAVLERGLAQRMTALNLFLEDIYGHARNRLHLSVRQADKPSPEGRCRPSICPAG